MDDSAKTRLEWMRLEFQDARRRHLVLTSEPSATPRANAETHPPAPTVLIDPAATKQPTDHPKAR